MKYLLGATILKVAAEAGYYSFESLDDQHYQVEIRVFIAAMVR
jgi:hypothetical protein